MQEKLYRCKAEGFGFCDSEGNQITPCIYDQVKTNEYFNAFKIEGLWGFVDETGKCIQEATFKDIFFIGRFVVADNHIYDSVFIEYEPVQNISKIKFISSFLLMITDKDGKMYVFSTETEQLVETVGMCDNIIDECRFLVCVKGQNEIDIIDIEDLELLQKITEGKFISCKYMSEGYLFVLQLGEEKIMKFFHYPSNTIKNVDFEDTIDDFVVVDCSYSYITVVAKCKFRNRYRIYNIEFDSNIIDIAISSSQHYYISFTTRDFWVRGKVWCGLLENGKVEMICTRKSSKSFDACSIRRANRHIGQYYFSDNIISKSDFDQYMLKD